MRQAQWSPAPCFWLSGCKSKVPMTPSLGLIVCKNSSQNSGKQFTYNLVRLPVYYKEVFSKAARWKRCTGHSMWAGLRAPLPSPGTFTSLPTRKLAKSPSLDLYRGFIILGFPGGLDGKESASSAGDPGSISRSYANFWDPNEHLQQDIPKTTCRWGAVPGPASLRGMPGGLCQQASLAQALPFGCSSEEHLIYKACLTTASQY